MYYRWRSSRKELGFQQKHTNHDLNGQHHIRRDSWLFALLLVVNCMILFQPYKIHTFMEWVIEWFRFRDITVYFRNRLLITPMKRPLLQKSHNFSLKSTTWWIPCFFNSRCLIFFDLCLNIWGRQRYNADCLHRRLAESKYKWSNVGNKQKTK
jgi:hypothetical protein